MNIRILKLGLPIFLLVPAMISCNNANNQKEKEISKDDVAPVVVSASDSAPSVTDNEPVKEPVAAVKRETAPKSQYPMAQGSYTFTGKAEGRWPIVVYINVSEDGIVSGKMAYNSTLRKYGDTERNYMVFNGKFDGSTLKLNGEFANGHKEDWDLNCTRNGNIYSIKGTAHNFNRNKTFSIDATSKRQGV